MKQIKNRIVVDDGGHNNEISIDNSASQNTLKRSIKLSGNNNKIYIGSEVQLKNSLIRFLGNNSSIYISEKTILNGANFIIDSGSSIQVGANTTFSRVSLRAEGAASIVIGNDCMFSSDVYVRTCDGHGIFSISEKKLLNSASDVVIEDNVWVGRFAKINKGVRVGQSSIIGQASLVTKNVDNNSLYAGLPAKKIKSDVIWSRTMSFNDISKKYLDE